MGSDRTYGGNVTITVISIHAAQVGSDCLTAGVQNTLKSFQSTLPKWAATVSLQDDLIRKTISIHAAQVGSDRLGRNSNYTVKRFQSTLPKWAATYGGAACRRSKHISIHAAQVGSDTMLLYLTQVQANFNPRCPSGQRPLKYDAKKNIITFQSTLPKWAATRLQSKPCYPSVHFNPRCPSGQRRLATLKRRWKISISIHAAQVGSDAHASNLEMLAELFQSTLPKWAATPMASFKRRSLCHFNPRCPSGQRHNTVVTFAAGNMISIHAAQVGSDHFVWR